MVEELTATKEQWKETSLARRNKQLLESYQNQIKKLAKTRMCAEVAILDEDFLIRCMNFYDKLCKFMLNLALGPEGREAFGCDSQLPENPAAPLALASLPEFYIEDVAEFLLFLANWKPDLMTQSNVDVNKFLLLFICRSQWVSNPYLVAKLVEVLFVLVPEFHTSASQSTIFFENLISSNLAVCNLGPALMNFYTRKFFLFSYREWGLISFIILQLLNEREPAQNSTTSFQSGITSVLYSGLYGTRCPTGRRLSRSRSKISFFFPHLFAS
jgi:ubiquitin conjugation factor E4 B